MPKPTTTTEGRDYGKRLYVSRQAYQKQMRRLTDAHRDRGAPVPHSESKKPYLPDQKYQEMEYFDYPWDGPTFPGYPGIPDDPRINDDPEVNGFHGGNPPKDTGSEFLGCEFIGPFVPTALNAGDTAAAHLARRDDPIIGFTVHGPATLLTGREAVNCTSKYQRTRAINGAPPQPSSPECTVILRVDDPIDFEKWGTQGGEGEIVVVAHTLSGGSCSTSAFFLTCGNEDPLTWDTAESSTTITQNNSCSVAVLGGQGPFYWAVSGTGFSMAVGKTAHYDRNNVLVASGSACGVAIITVTDTCGNTTIGLVRCTDSGFWYEFTDDVCYEGGAETSYGCAAVYGDHIREGIRYKCMSQYSNIAGGSSDWTCEQCLELCAATPNVFCEVCVEGSCATCESVPGLSGTNLCCQQYANRICIAEVTRTCYEWRCS